MVGWHCDRRRMGPVTTCFSFKLKFAVSKNSNSAEFSSICLPETPGNLLEIRPADLLDSLGITRRLVLTLRTNACWSKSVWKVQQGVKQYLLTSVTCYHWSGGHHLVTREELTEFESDGQNFRGKCTRRTNCSILWYDSKCNAAWE